jgi:preprotein translocase subunit SecG
VCAAVFFVCTLSLAYFSNDRSAAPTGSVLDRPAMAPPAASAAASGAALIPGTSGAPAASAPSAATLPASGAGAIPTK